MEKKSRTFTMEKVETLVNEEDNMGGEEKAGRPAYSRHDIHRKRITQKKGDATKYESKTAST
jgi:hypothetical protein